ncbi:uncharacterized protein BcabD6B2_48080 [Babesia caballi]|uniref:Uncharacterized protein n=1 Tax=Babesia caballi TaxID=5871 RepID=A0AAV4M061_BABCB|nr:hypothetical protein BcabD6B2_48080 [Babesia caballi]
MAKKPARESNSTAKKTKKPGNRSLSEYNTEKDKLNTLFKSIRGKSTASVSAPKPKKAQKDASKNPPLFALPAKAKEDYTQVPVSGTVRKRTEDNLPVYTVEELNIGKGGGTELCPFDCHCCY